LKDQAAGFEFFKNVHKAFSFNIRPSATTFKER